MIYLDSAATSNVDGESAKVAYEASLNSYFNPSSLYKNGLATKQLLSSARETIATQLNCKKEDLYFCSSATEANNIVISSLLQLTPSTIFTTPLEHPSVYAPLQRLKKFGWQINEIPLSRNGQIDIEKFETLITDKTVAIFAIYVCNENGIINDIKKLGSIVARLNKTRSRKIHLHADCVQALAKVEVDLELLKVNSASFSGHKIGAVRGGGLLYLNRSIVPLYDGGGQEKGIRSGTENLAAISSLSYSIKKTLPNVEQNSKKVLSLKKFLIDELEKLNQKQNIIFLPVQNKEELLNEKLFSPYILQLSILPLPAEVLVRIFDDNDILISSGSACSSNSKQKIARVANALKIDPKISASSIRLSFDTFTTINEIETFLAVLKEKVLPLC